MVPYPDDFPPPAATVFYCRCGRKLGAQDPGYRCSTCKWLGLALQQLGVETAW
jgi:hypothetical protein